MTRLILIRHGQTDYTLEKRYCGSNDPGLNELGVFQVEKLYPRLAKMKIDKIYSSDLIRTYQTAGIVFKNLSIEKDPCFREINFGVFEGLTYDQAMEKYPILYQKWITNPLEASIPEAERFSDFVKRVREKLQILIRKHQNQTISIVTHGGVIGVILTQALNYGLDKIWEVIPNLASLSVIDYDSEFKPKVLIVNDTSDLVVC